MFSGLFERPPGLKVVFAEGGIASLAITEPTAGSDATGMKMRFAPQGDDIVIDGGKIFITSGDVADRLLLFGKWSGIDDAKGAISSLIVEKGTPGLIVGRLEDKMGHRGASTAELRFDGARVPRANLLGAPGEGLKILLASLNKSRPSVAAHALGIARAAFEETVGYINQRTQSRRRIVEFQGIQFMLADMATGIEAARLLAWQAAWRADQGLRQTRESAIAKLFATDMCMRATTDAVQIFGGYGYMKDFPVEKYMRDAKLLQIYEGTNQIQRLVIARHTLGA